MAYIKKLNRELLKAMDKHEIRSINYSNVILVKGNRVIDAGKVVDKLNTNEKITKLWDEFVYNEYGTNDLNEIMKMEGF